MAGTWNGWSLGRAAWVAVVLAVVLALVGPAGNAVRSAGGESGESLPPDLRAVPGDAVGFLSVRLADLWKREAAAGLQAQLAKVTPHALDEWRSVVGLPPEDIERWTAVFPHLEIGPGPYPLFFVETAKPYDRAKVLANIAPDGKEEKRNGKVLYAGSNGHAVHFLDDRAYVASSAGAIRDLLERPAPRDGERMTGALRLAAGKHTAVAGFNPEPVVREFGDNLPGQAAPFKPLLKADLVTLTVDAAAGLDGKLRFHFPEEKEAKQAQPVAAVGLRLARATFARWVKDQAREAEGGGSEAEKLVALLRRIEDDLNGARARRQGEAVELTAHLKTRPEDAAVLIDEAVVRSRQTADIAKSQNNLRQLAIAMHNYASMTNASRFPPQAVFSPDGKPLLSWRVLLLSQLGEEKLYKEFHLNEPWDSAHNKKLLARMPKVYALPGSPAGTTDTYYLAFVGKSAFFDGKKGLTIPASFPDGTSNTIMFVEAAKGVPWTKPEDLPFDPDPTKPLPKLGRYRGGFDVAMVDGSTRFVRNSVSNQTLRAAITRDGGEVLGPDF
jgi:hypothetical protein